MLPNPLCHPRVIVLCKCVDMWIQCGYLCRIQVGRRQEEIANPTLGDHGGEGLWRHRLIAPCPAAKCHHRRASVMDDAFCWHDVERAEQKERVWRILAQIREQMRIGMWRRH